MQQLRSSYSFLGFCFLTSLPLGSIGYWQYLKEKAVQEVKEKDLRFYNFFKGNELDLAKSKVEIVSAYRKCLVIKSSDDNVSFKELEKLTYVKTYLKGCFILFGQDSNCQHECYKPLWQASQSRWEEKFKPLKE